MPMTRASHNPTLVLAAALMLNVVGPSTFLILPMLVDGAVHTLGFSAREVGLMSFALSSGTMLSALLSGIWVRSVSWPRAALIFLCGMVAANVLSLYLHAFWPFVLLQGAAGFFGGCLGCLTMTVLSDHHDPARNFGLAMAMQVTFQVAGLLAGPVLLRIAGMNGILAMLAALSTVSMLLLPLLPRSGRVVMSQGVAGAFLKPAVLLALFGCLAFFMNVGAYWTYVELLGGEAGMTSRVVASCVAGGVSAGIPGGLLATAIGNRYGRLKPLWIATAMTVVSVLLLWNPPGIMIFVLSGILYNFAWNFALAYQLEAVNAVDPTGRAVAVAGAFYNLGSASGAGLTALFVSPHHYGAVIWMVVASVTVSAVLFVYSGRNHRHPTRLSAGVAMAAAEGGGKGGTL
jgi:predicted MFS family arabinose efflux permease